MIKGSLTLLLLAAWGAGASNISSTRELLKHYDSATKKTYQRYIRAYNNVRTLQDFRTVYAQMTRATEAFAKPLQKELDQWQTLADRLQPGQKLPPQPAYQWAEKTFPGLDIGLEAEGTAVVMRPSWLKLSTLARKTASKQDDQFVSLMRQLHGDVETSYPVWMTQTWDYGGCSHLGSGKHSQFLKALRAQMNAQSPFKKTLQQQETYLIGDLLTNKDFCQSQASALKEMRGLIANYTWSGAQKQKLQARYRALQGKTFSFNTMNP